MKDPACVISGNGALVGTINLVSRQSIFRRNAGQALLSYGSFHTARALSPAMDSAEITIPDAPRPDEILIALCLGVGLLPRIGT